MRLSACLLALGLPLLCATALPASALPLSKPAATAPVATPVNFIDRLLKGGSTQRGKSTAHRRKKTAMKSKSTAPVTSLPAIVPIPIPKPSEEKPETAPAPSVVEDAPAPIPTPAPAAASPPAPAPEPVPVPKPAPAPEAKGNADKPDAEPEKTEESKDPSAPPATPADTAKPDADHPALQPDDDDSELVIEPEDPGALKACLSDLAALGARSETVKAIDEGSGCGIADPVKVDEILPGISLGGAVMRCETALGLAKWLKGSVQPALAVALPDRKLKGIVPGSTFACRLRNNASSGMLSEHARGNAFDIAAFTLDKGTVDMTPRKDDHTMEGALQKAVTAGACLYFTTVLAPGSDAAHETHMHVDVKARKNGYRICDVP